MLELIKKYVREYYSQLKSREISYSELADKILEVEDVDRSHRTIRKMLSEVFNEVDGYSEGQRSWIEDRPQVRQLQPYRGGNPDNVLVIGDTHLPFGRRGYLEHCREVQERFDCGRVVHIGDLIDSSYSSYHETDPDGYSAGEELDRAIGLVAEWYRVFPKVDVCLGNHDRIIQRKAFSNGVSSRWIRGYGDVLQTPNWNYDLEFVYNNVLYTHTLGANAMASALNRRQSVVVGHEHTKAEIKWNVSNVDRLFSMNVGWGGDDRSYAFAYAKLNQKKSVVSCGVVLGELPIIVPMSL